MNWEQIEERWVLYRAVAAKLWPNVPAEDLEKTGGDRRLLAKALKQHYGYLSAFTEEELDRFYTRCALVTEGPLKAFPSGQLIAPPNPTDDYISS